MKGPPRSFADTDIGASAFSSTAVVEAAYKRIKEEIEGLEAGIRVWKARHNTLSIIARLPPEILSMIFKCVAAAQQSNISYKMRWIYVTHVCTHWRRVALDDPSLWTTIPFSHPRWATEMLERSKMAPLTVVAELSSNSPHMELLKSSLTRIARIQKLSLTQNYNYPHESLLEMILADLVEPAPRLQSLEVSFNDKSSIHTLGPRLFSGEVPRLRELELRDCGLTWDAPFLRNLTSLKMSFVPPSARPSMCHIMAVLSNMSSLTTLVLRHVLPEGSPDAATGEVGSGVVARLPQLTHLCIESDVPEGAFLLDHLVYPMTVSIILVGTVKCESVNTADVSYNLPSVRSFCKVLGKFQPVRCVSARLIQYSKYIRLLTYDMPGTCSQPPSNAKVDFTLKLASLQFDHAKVWGDIHQCLWTSISTKDLESLHVIEDIQSSVESADWLHIFTNLAATKLTSLRVAGGSGIKFLRVLSPDAPAPQTGRTKRRIPLKFPSLRELAIEGWTLDDTENNASCFDLLKIFLEDRRKRRAAIKELSLTDCFHITDDDVESLEKIVKNVVWDGFENFSEEEEEEACEACGLVSCDGYDCEDEPGYDHVDYDFYMPW